MTGQKVAPLTPSMHAELIELVIANFAIQLHAADPGQFDRLAQRAEALTATDLGPRERRMVELERALRAAGPS